MPGVSHGPGPPSINGPHQPEADPVRLCPWRIRSPVRAPAPPGRVNATASRNPPRLVHGGRLCRPHGIDSRTFIEPVPPVPDPFLEVSEHVVQPVPVGLLGPDVRWIADGQIVAAVHRDLVQVLIQAALQLGKGSIGVIGLVQGREAASARRVLPLGLGGKPSLIVRPSLVGRPWLGISSLWSRPLALACLWIARGIIIVSIDVSCPIPAKGPQVLYEPLHLAGRELGVVGNPDLIGTDLLDIEQALDVLKL